MIEIKNKSMCCGCYGCFNICPQKAIEMKEDIEGFRYPIVDKEKCTNCGLCEKVCPILNKKYIEGQVYAYACINKDDKTREESSSGGLFTLISEEIIKRKGIVFGAKFNNELNVVHSYAETLEELGKFRGSKYVQSQVGECYKKAEEFLKNDRYVLFTGTPCQIEGLYTFLRKEYDKLYTQDIICHGVPSPKVWDKYKEFVNEKYNSNITNMKFREKSTGWNTYSLKYNLQNNREVIESNQDSLYMKAFLRDVILRESCYKCKFKTKSRRADITLADCWGIEKMLPELYDNKGTSLVIVHSEKGNELLEKVGESIIYKKIELDEAIKFNCSMILPAKKPKERKKFFREIDDISIEKLIEVNLPKDKKMKKIVSKIKKMVKNIIKKN